MKFLLSGISLLCCLFVTAQRPCEFSANVTDSIGSYKSTKEYMVFEKNFAGKSTYVFNSFVVTDGMPLLNVQFLEKSDGFIKAKCLDKNSKLYIQLNNGKIVTLLHIDKSDCGNLIRDDKGMNNRVLSGYFKFRKEDYNDLKQYPVSFIRVKFATDVEDYITRKAIKSELNGELYEPDTYFMNYLHCIEAKN